MIRMIRMTRSIRSTRTPSLAVLAILSAMPIQITATAQDAETAAHFGFDALEVVPVGPNAGPLLSTDLDADGLEDLVVVNNHKSRIEFLRQRQRRVEISSCGLRDPPARDGPERIGETVDRLDQLRRARRRVGRDKGLGEVEALRVGEDLP